MVLWVCLVILAPVHQKYIFVTTMPPQNHMLPPSDHSRPLSGKPGTSRSLIKTVLRKIQHTVLTLGLIIGMVFGDDVQANQRWIQNGPTRIALPKAYKPKQARLLQFKTDAYILKAYARSFAQGELMYVEILSPNISKKEQSGQQLKGDAFPAQYTFTMSFAGRSVWLTKRKWGRRGFVAIPPVMPVGNQILKIIMFNGREHMTHKHSIHVTDTVFPAYKSQLELGAYSDKTKGYTARQLAFIRACSAKKKRAFSLRSSPKILSRLSHPRNEHHVTSPFYSSRVVSRYRMVAGKRKYLKPRRNIHSGLDLRGLTGAPIYALADGKIAIAQKMFFEGNVTFLDHGEGILSFYMHQSKLEAHEGSRVRAGELIGRTGATGMVTGPHLHISLYVMGIPVHPLSILSLPVRD